MNGALALAAIGLALAGLPAVAQDAFKSARPQGYFGDGHAEHHDNYQGLRNGMGGSCCNGRDGRPTQGRWNAATESWEAMVNGKWQTVPWPNVLDDGVLSAQKRPRWDNQSHVFAGEHMRSDGTYTIYCFIPPSSGN